MSCSCCTPTCKKWTLFSIAALCIAFGIALVFEWTSLLNTIMNQQLSLTSTNTLAYGMWKKTPIPMFIEFYLFNWTNHKEVEQNNKIKPQFSQLGPYTFSEVHIKENVTFNNDSTITFLNNRLWHFRQDMSSGSLSDKITNINVIAATVAFLVRDKHYLVRRGVNFFMEEKNVKLTTTKTAGELLFDGYDDPMLDLVHKINITGVNITMSKFGWFVERNGSSIYDGVFTMHNGGDGIRKLGILTKWNESPDTGMYPGACGKVNGTTGEQWYPVEEDQLVSVFSSDVCSTLVLNRTGKVTKHGVNGYRYAGGDSVFDNGEHYPERKCYFTGKLPDGNDLPSGVRNVSKCRFGAPAFVSYPHFYLADPYYRNAIDGMKPNKSEHEFFLSLEPNTGIPLEVSASVQINILVLQTHGINIFENITTTFMPTLWFRQTAELSESLANQAKMLLVLPDVGTYTGYGILGIGILLCITGVVVTLRNGWKGSDEHYLLSQQSI